MPGEPDPGPFQKYEYVKLRKVVPFGIIRVFDEKLDAKTHLYLQGDERNRAEGKPPVPPAAPAFLAGDRLAVEPVELTAAAYYPGLKWFIQEEEFLQRALAAAAARSTLASAQQALAQARRQSAALADDREVHHPAEPRVQDARARTDRALPAAENAVLLGEARLAAAEADLKAIQARIVADRVKFGQTPGDARSRAQAASRAERQAAHQLSREKRLQAEQAVAAARTKVEAAPAGKEKDQAKAAAAKAEQQLAAARQAQEAAEKGLEAVTEQYTPLSPVYPARSSGRRRALAEWITARENPLAARVAVNHVWMRHFDRALVESVFDFGRNGKKPSHPELLDWLAVEFMESGWSMKHLHRLIVTSTAYRLQSSAGEASASSQSRDPDNTWLWRFRSRRIEAEVVRDSLLHVSGQLDRTIGGPVLENKEEATSRRRSLYFSVYPEDGGSLRFLELFDAPDPCECYRRSESIVPQQALALTNSRLLLDLSRLLARQLPGGGADDFIVAAFEQVLTRRPTAQEQAACREFLGRQVELFRSTRTPPASSEGGVAPSPDPEMRARESLVRALFSHADFVTLR
jgi:hypothetical protein